MPSTYTLIASNVLSTTAASVTFSAIPDTYTDLVIRASMRTNASARLDDPTTIQFNTGLVSNTSMRSQYSSGVVQSFRDTAASSTGIGWVNATDSTANTFSNCEIYIPNYSNTSIAKPFSSAYMMENNASQAHGWIQATFLNTTSAITSITLAGAFGSLVSGSSFYLYGISKS